MARVSDGEGISPRGYLMERVSDGEGIWWRGYLIVRVSDGEGIWRRGYLMKRVSDREGIWQRGYMNKRVSDGEGIWWRGYLISRVSDYKGLLQYCSDGLPLSIGYCISKHPLQEQLQSSSGLFIDESWNTVSRRHDLRLKNFSQKYLKSIF